MPEPNFMNDTARVREAAEDMLKALRLAKRRIEQLCSLANTLAGFQKVRAEDWAEPITAAIAKAEGKTPPAPR